MCTFRPSWISIPPAVSSTRSLPAGRHGGVLHTDITEAAGVDIDSIVTWDDYVAAGKQVLEKTGKPMTVIETTDMAPFQAMVLQKGSDFLDAEGNVILDCATNIELLEYLKSWMDEASPSPCPAAETLPKSSMSSSTQRRRVRDSAHVVHEPPDRIHARPSGKSPCAPCPYGSGGHRGIHHRLHRRQRRCNHQSVRIARAGKDFLYFCKMSYDAQVQCYEMLAMLPTAPTPGGSRAADRTALLLQ